MDIATFQSLWTIIVLVIFLAIVIWAWSANRTTEFDAAARIPLDDNDFDSPSERGQIEENAHG